MYTIVDLKDNKSRMFEDGQLLEELKKIFPSDKKNLKFLEWIKAHISLHRYWKNFQFSIKHNSYDPTKFHSIVKGKLTTLKNIPHNNSAVKRDRNFNEWILCNTTNGKMCIFYNLAELARCMNIDYQYLYQGISKHTYFDVDVYRFARNTNSEREHCLNMLSEVL